MTTQASNVRPPLFRQIAAALLTLVLASCASQYGSASITGGYSQQKVSDTVWVVSYYGNAYTSDETVQTYWLHRCAEIAIEQGYDGFRIATKVDLVAAPLAPTNAANAVYRPGADVPARLIPVVESGYDGKPYLVARIILLRAPLPEAPRQVFDARALLNFLGSYVKGPLCDGNVCPHVHRYLFPGFGRGEETASAT